jgi:hypothetical protein
MDSELKNCLWNTLYAFYWSKGGYGAINFYRMIPEMCAFIKTLWNSYFKKPIDTIPDDWIKTCEVIRNYYYNAKWHEVYDFIEFVASNYPDEYRNVNFVEECNNILERELSGYRFVGKQITPLTSDVEITAVEEAMNTPSKLVNAHVENAMKLFSSRKSPDYRNSIKESISAVEAACRLILKNKKATLGDALDTIEREGKIKLHGALKRAFDSLYGYTSSADGIRHAFSDEKIHADFDEAKFMLVSCSAFVNYLVSKASKAGIKMES